MLLLPPNELRATLTPGVFDKSNAPDVAIAHPTSIHQDTAAQGRRGFLRLAAAAAGMGLFAPLAAQAGPLVFNMGLKDEGVHIRKRDEPAEPEVQTAPAVQEAAREEGTQLVINGRQQQEQQAMKSLALGEIPRDFWERPRELHLQRQGTSERVRIAYWKDGKIVPDGYWAICRVLRDVRANMMTYMDPAMLDILRGIVGYYEAWNWQYPIIITSGYRTAGTNNGLAAEGAAKNSMHLYGRATDLYMQRIPVEHLAALGKHFQRGGVGFYPGRGFVHLDTGKLRSWRG